MNVLKEVLRHQVYPAMGCTEPASVALCAAHAAKALGEPVREALFLLDPGTYKNGMGVSLPNARGGKGNLLAGALGLLIADPGLRMEILRAATPAVLRRAKALLRAQRVRCVVAPDRRDSYVEVQLSGRRHRAVCVIAGSHTEVVLLERDGRALLRRRTPGKKGVPRFKVHTGGLAPICGCAIAAAVGAAAGIVYQRNGPDIRGISLAINNVISDIGGMLCDGAKSGCALKVVSSSDTAIRSAYMGIHHYGITEVEGFVGRRAEETIRNLAKISTIGMAKVDDTIVGIMMDKQSAAA